MAASVGLCAVLIAMGLASGVQAQPAPPAPAPPSVQPPRLPPPPLPWDGDFAVLKNAFPDLQKGGIRALAPHVRDFQAALDNGKQYFPNGAMVDGKRYVLADGTTETLGAMIQASVAAKKEGGGMPTVAIPNAYPVIAFELGSYYNDIGRPEDALYVLDEGLTLSPFPGDALGTTAGHLLSEKGYALNMLKRYDEALAFFDKVLANKAIPTLDKARLYRGQGLTFTELNRLDEAEAAYKTSLSLEPNNPQALRELDYIARLKAGGDRKPVVTFTSHPPPAPAPPQ